MLVAGKTHCQGGLRAAFLYFLSSATFDFQQEDSDLRERRGLSQEDLGSEAELDRTYVSGIERGVRNPTLTTIWRLAKALGVASSRLLKAAEE